MFFITHKSNNGSSSKRWRWVRVVRDVRVNVAAVVNMMIYELAIFWGMIKIQIQSFTHISTFSYFSQHKNILIPPFFLLFPWNGAAAGRRKRFWYSFGRIRRENIDKSWLRVDGRWHSVEIFAWAIKKYIMCCHKASPSLPPFRHANSISSSFRFESRLRCQKDTTPTHTEIY